MDGETPRTRVALVTGAARRIGRAIALDLARDGWIVAIHCNRSRVEAETTAGEITAAGGRAHVFAADLSHEDAAAGLIPAIAAAIGAPEALVNNAAPFEFDDIETATRQSWDAHMEPALRAPFVLTQAFARHLPDAAPEGAVINIIDQRVWNLTPMFMSYTVAKAGLWTLTRTLALALAPRIRVNAIGPGPVLPSPRQSEAHFARQVASTPLARATPPEEIAAAARFILSARSMTGQMIALDAGQHLAWRWPGGDLLE